MKKLQIAVLLAVGAACFVVWFFGRTDDRLCNVIYTLVARSGATVGKPGSPGYAYYREHPDELKKARAQNQEFLHQLPCGG